MLFLLIPYQLLFPLIGLGVLLRFLMVGRGKSLREGYQEIRQRLGLINAGLSEPGASMNRTLWIHAASIGEVGAVSQLIAMIVSRTDHLKIVLTTSTVTGREKARNLPDVDLAVLAPMDFYPAVSSFLNRTRPSALFLVETELWPATLYLAHRRNIPIAIVNGRLTPRSFAKYRWIRRCVSPFLRLVSHAMVQTPEDAERLRALGLPLGTIRVTGNLKHDIPPPNEINTQPIRKLLARAGWEDCSLWVVGSVHPGSEMKAVMDAFIQLRPHHSSLRLIVAPRHIERTEEIMDALRAHDISHMTFSHLRQESTFTRSHPKTPSPLWGEGGDEGDTLKNTQCLLIDELGHLNNFYSLCTVAFVGGTLAPVGGHNLLEPAVAGKPVIFGPHTESTTDVAQALESSGGGLRIRDAQTLFDVVDRLLKDSAHRRKTGELARQTAERLSGATKRTLHLLSFTKLI